MNAVYGAVIALGAMALTLYAVAAIKIAVVLRNWRG